MGMFVNGDREQADYFRRMDAIEALGVSATTCGKSAIIAPTSCGVWIPCSERNPSLRRYPDGHPIYDEEYFVTVTGGIRGNSRYIDQLKWDGKHWYGRAFTMPKRRVIAWMDNPREPYTGDLKRSKTV